MRKRLITIFLAVCLMAAALPVTAFAANEYCINGVTVRYDDFSSRPNNCRAYAELMYEKIWNDDFSSNFYSSDNFLRGLDKEQLTLTEEHLKEYVTHAALGSTIRVSSPIYLHRNDGGLGHSQIIVQKDENGFTVLEGGLAEYPYRAENYYTWSDYVNAHWLGGKYDYIKYIKWPGAPEYYEGYMEDVPQVSAPLITTLEDGSGFTISYTATDDVEITDAYVHVWPQGQTEENAIVYPCSWDGTTATATVDCGTGDVRNFYYKWYAVDGTGHIGGADQTPRMISLYTAQIDCLGSCQVQVDNAPVCSAPNMRVGGEDTVQYRASLNTHLSVTGITRNEDGERWYRLASGYWISEEYVRYDTFSSFIEWLYCSDPDKSIIYLDKQLLFIVE